MKRLILNNTLQEKSEISCSENKKKLFFLSKGKKFHKIHLDSKEYEKFLLSSPRCDFIIVSEELSEIALWIELKGHNLDKAFKQLLSAQQIFGQKIKKNYGAIVCSRVPKDSDFQNNKIKWKNKFKTSLFVREKQLKLTYSAESNSITE